MKNQKILEIKSKLGNLEEKILSLIDDEKISPREMMNKLRNNKFYAYTTVMTVMDRLYKKGYLKREKIGRTFYYKKIDDFEKMINRNNIDLVDSLIGHLGRLNLLDIYLMLILFKPLIMFLRRNGNLFYVKSIYYLLVFILSTNILLNSYLNGFFEYMVSIFQNPSFLLSNLRLNFLYIFETIPVNNIILLILGYFIFNKFVKHKGYKLNI